MTQETNAVNWFEIPVSDMDRAQRFYEGALGVTLTVRDMGPNRMAMFPRQPKAAGASGALVKGPGYVPSQKGSMVYMHVNDIEHTLSAIERGGGKPLMPKTSIGEGGFIASFTDCEGNRVALHAYT